MTDENPHAAIISNAPNLTGAESTQEKPTGSLSSAQNGGKAEESGSSKAEESGGSPTAENKPSGKETEPNTPHAFANFQIQLDQLTTDYKLALNERKKGIRIALIIAFFGFLFFVFSVCLLCIQWDKATSAKNDVIESVKKNAVANASIVNAAIANANTASVNVATTSVICGALLEFVALATFYFYGRVSTDLQDRLDINKRFLLANIICEGMDNESRQKAQAKLVEALLEYKEQDSAKPTETERANNNSPTNQPPQNPK